jgi:sugar lactone lactonase YvrE
MLPSAIAFDPIGNLYFAETANHTIRRVDTTGAITTIAGTGTQGFSGDNGPATAATLDSPQGLALDTANNLYLADTHNHRIRKLNLITGTITTIAGTGTPGFSGDHGPATASQLCLPTALAIDGANNLYLADTGNHRIREISPSGTITTVAGTGIQGFSGDKGPAIDARIDSSMGVAIDSADNLYLSDTHNHRIRRIDATTGIITTIAGTGTPGFSGDTGSATSSNLFLPHGITIDSAGNLYLADTENHRIRRIDATSGIVITVAGNGTQSFGGENAQAITASLDTPLATAVSPSALVTLSDSANQRIRQLTAAPGPATTIHTIAGLGAVTPGTLTLLAPSIIAYGTGQLTATLDYPLPATGVVTFLNGNTTLGAADLSANIATYSTASLPAGSYSLIAAYSGDQTHGVVQSPPVSLTIIPVKLSATISPVAILYGQPAPGITSTLTGVLPQDVASLSVTFSNSATNSSPVGTYPIAATLAGSAAGNYTIANPAADLVINPAPALITLDPIADATSGTLVTVTAHVVSTTTGEPTGTVTFLDDSTPAFTTPVSATGVAVLNLSTLTQGSHAITAVYNGSANFKPANSPAQRVTITTAPGTNPDFTLASTNTTSQTIVSGSSASYTFSVQFQTAMSSPITLAASGLPNLATASFNPPILPPGSTTNTFTLTIATPGSANLKKIPSVVDWAILIFPFATLALRRRSHRSFILLSLTLLFATGCGDRISAVDPLVLSTKTYTITVTGTATTSNGSILQHSTNVTLILEQPQ